MTPQTLLWDLSCANSVTCSLEFVQPALVHGVLADRSEGIVNRGTIGRKGRGTTVEDRLDDKAVTCLARWLAVLISPSRSPTLTDDVRPYLGAANSLGLPEVRVPLSGRPHLCPFLCLPPNPTTCNESPWYFN